MYWTPFLSIWGPLYTFSASLTLVRPPGRRPLFAAARSAEERKYVHHLAEQFGLKHEHLGV